MSAMGMGNPTPYETGFDDTDREPEMPPRISAWRDWSGGSLRHHWSDGPEAPGDRYVRADLVPQWQPIETAPKDGTELLLWRKRGPFVQASMVVGLLAESGRWIESYEGGPILPEPILWQPLPGPPEATTTFRSREPPMAHKPRKAGAIPVRITTGKEGVVSEAMSEVPLTHPMRAAWETYKDTDAYANVRKWAIHKEAGERGYVDGSLWTAFVAGWEAALTERPSVGVGHPSEGQQDESSRATTEDE